MLAGGRRLRCRTGALSMCTMVVVLILGACGGGSDSDGSSAGTTGRDGSSATTAPRGDGDGSGAAGNPCASVTDDEFTAMFGAEVEKGEPAGSSRRCTLSAAGNSSGQQFEFQNLTESSLSEGFEQTVGSLVGCGGASPEEVPDLGDRAVVDVSCLTPAGNGTLIVEHDGDVLGFYVRTGGAADVDPDEAKDALVAVATRWLER